MHSGTGWKDFLADHSKYKNNGHNQRRHIVGTNSFGFVSFQCSSGHIDKVFHDLFWTDSIKDHIELKTTHEINMVFRASEPLTNIVT